MPLVVPDIDAIARTSAKDVIPPEALLPILTSPPFVPSRSLFNLRDVGLVEGSKVPAGRIYRCGALDNAAKDPEAMAWLAANVRRVFDLRKGGAERDTAPDPEIPGVENVWIPGEDNYPMPDLAVFATDGGKAAWKAQYLNVARAYKPTYKAVLEHLRDRPTEPFLFHCTAGRDRTGVLGGLIHHLAGTPDDVAVHDYMLSRIGIEPAREKLIQYALLFSGATDVETPGFLSLVELKPEYWAAFLEGLNEEYGGWDGYVTKGLCLSEEDLTTIKENLRVKKKTRISKLEKASETHRVPLQN